MKKIKEITEAMVQRRVVKALKEADWMVTKLQSTSTNGWPDLLAIKGGRVVFIEVKRPGGQLSGVQVIRHKMMRHKGAEVVVMDNAEGVKGL
jgi:Holliday junction resolvase